MKKATFDRLTREEARRYLASVPEAFEKFEHMAETADYLMAVADLALQENNSVVAEIYGQAATTTDYMALNFLDSQLVTAPGALIALANDHPQIAGILSAHKEGKCSCHTN